MKDDDSTPPVWITSNTNVKMPVSLLATLLGMCAVGAGAWFNLKSDVAELANIRAKVDAHEQALAKLDVMANDIVWIKGELLRRQREDLHRSP